MSSNEQKLSDVTQGALKAVWDIGKSEIQTLIQRLKNRELIFIEDQEIIDTVKSQKERPQFQLIRKYIKDRNLRVIIQMGLTLKSYSSDNKKLQSLRTKIVKKYGDKGLHIAELVQCDALSRYVGLLLGSAPTEKDLEDRLEEILQEIEKYAVFIQASDDITVRSDEVVTRLLANIPKAMILFSKGKTAIRKSSKVWEKIKPRIKGYSFEEQSEPETEQQYHFILKT